MTEWISMILDAALIAVVGAGVVQAIRLIRQLQDLRASRTEMERFVRDFNGAVTRAEAGIKALRAAARDSGDDLERLVDKALKVRDELNFIVESADGVADRLTAKTSTVLHSDKAPPQREAEQARAPAPQTERQPIKPAAAKQAAPAVPDTPVASRAEQELLQALKKLS